MFGSLFRRTTSLKEMGFFEGLIDFHSHILPGVDDGVKEISDALTILDQYERLGIERATFTPHLMEDFHQNNTLSLKEKFDDFRKQYTGGVKLHLAGEYMLDSRFEKHLEEGKLLTLSGSYLLIETSYLTAPLNLWETIDQIMRKGYFVVLAHPERYVYMNRSDYSRLAEIGVLFQLNLLSTTGYYGNKAQENAEYLMGCNMYHLLGTDLHHARMLSDKICTLKLNSKTINKLFAIKEKSKKLIK